MNSQRITVYPELNADETSTNPNQTSHHKCGEAHPIESRAIKLALRSSQALTGSPQDL